MALGSWRTYERMSRHDGVAVMRAAREAGINRRTGPRRHGPGLGNAVLAARPAGPGRPGRRARGPARAGGHPAGLQPGAAGRRGGPGAAAGGRPPVGGHRGVLRPGRGILTGKYAGGASIGQQALAAGLADEIRLHVAPVLAGRGLALFGASQAELRCVQAIPGEGALHLRYEVRRG
jgi:hypothetical protein